MVKNDSYHYSKFAIFSFWDWLYSWNIFYHKEVSMIARQCSSCGGMCGGGYTVSGRYKFCKAENIKKKQCLNCVYFEEGVYLPNKLKADGNCLDLHINVYKTFSCGNYKELI